MPAFTVSMQNEKIVQFECAGGRRYELYFDSKGNAAAFRIFLQGVTGPQYITHKLAGARMPKGWSENLPLQEHTKTDFADKVGFFLRSAVQ